MQPLEIISRVLDDTYEPVSKSGTYSLKHSLQGNRLILKYSTIVHFASETALKPQVSAALDQAQQLMSDKIRKLKKDYKEKAGSALKIEERGGDDNVELIQSTSNSLRKVAYYRYNQVVDLIV